MRNPNLIENPIISWVIPCFNEADVIEISINRIKKVISLMKSKYEHEIIFIDDGSTDQTRKIIKAIAKIDTRIKLLGLSRNFGHQVALQAGLNFALGSAVIIIDADLQDPPEIACEMILKFHLIQATLD